LILFVRRGIYETDV